ncbi:MAG: CCA tRNA nucleotidyltransferase, partial [Actinobacteria bacterium]|nr:CCA tRNA nucleotidyltransferase [Actinomycetota bacterium]
VVAERLVGIRLHPRDKTVRAAAPAGIEFAPPRKEVSTGPGRHDFEIVADPALSVEDDMRRRDFTVNAMARRLSDGEIVDPLDGRSDLEWGVLRAVSDTSFAEDPLRIVRGLRFVSQLGFAFEGRTLDRMREDAPAVTLLSGERVSEELSKLLRGTRPEAALLLARDTGVLVHLVPQFAAVPEHLSDHIFAVVQASADAGDDLAVRLAALFHDVGKPIDPDPLGHARVGAEIAGETLVRLRFPARLTSSVVAIVAAHPYREESRPRTPAEVRRFLMVHGDDLAFQLVAMRLADLRAKDRDTSGLEELRASLERELSSPHRLSDLAIGGDDLIAAGFVEGPAVGEALQRLLEAVVDDPSLNTRADLLARVQS